MKNNKKNQVKRALKGILLFTVLSVASGCAGGGEGQQQSVSTDNTTSSDTAVASATQEQFKMNLCDEVNGWETDCRFLGMKLIKQNPEEIIPLTEKHDRGRGRGRNGRNA